MVHREKGWLAMKTAKENNTCVIFLEGEVSARNVPELQGELDEILAAHPGEELVFEARDLTYISSAGLRLLLGVQKKLGNKKLVVRNVSKDVYEIFEMTKFTMLMQVEKALREIDVTDATVVGKGRSSTVYRIGDETIVKLYAAGVPLEKIKQEIDLAKKAFVAGVPTAISYDMVTSKGAYGVVFEMLDNADTVGRTITAHPEQFDEIMEKFVAVYKVMHSTDIEEMGGFTSLKDTWNRWAEGMEANGSFTHEEADLLKQVIEAVPARSTMVHCDFHAGNVMYQQGEIVVIDMADIGFGHPIFDLAAGAFHARYSGSTTRQQVHGMSQENMLRFWDKLLALYFGAEDAQKLAEIKEMCDYFGLLRGALFPMKHVQIAPELKAFHVKETRKHLFPNIDKVLSAASRLPEFFK